MSLSWEPTPFLHIFSTSFYLREEKPPSRKPIVWKEKNLAAFLLKDIQFHPVTYQILHLDFLEVNEEKPIVMEVPVQLEGHAEGVRAGGKLQLSMRKLRVKAVYTNIPERLVINIDNLGLGKTMQVGDLHFEGLELMNAKNAVVCAVNLTRAARGAATKEYSFCLDEISYCRTG